jgi:hypothetical protein
MKFKFTWQGSRVPKEVTLPNGTVETVQYMRDGICLFMSQHNATYERLGDHEAEFTTIESFEQAKEAVANYQAAQQSGDGALCACKLPGFDANNPAICPTCGKPHRR